MKAGEVGVRSRTVVLIHYSEIWLKGKNRPFFERTLRENLFQASRSLGGGSAVKGSGHFLVPLRPGSDPEEVAGRLSRMPGIAWLAVARTAPLEIGPIEEEVLAMATADEEGSFRIDARRPNKNFPMTSVEINQRVGASVVDHTGRPVDLTSPDATYGIEVGHREAYVFSRRIRGIGGLPVGVSGGLLCLLSGGIDSPVAAWKMMKRGCQVSFVHFFNDTESRAGVRDKIMEIGETLSAVQGPSRLHVVPFGGVQRRIIQFVPAKYRMLVYRRVMFRLAKSIRRQEGALGYVTGDSVGQVASQTLSNIRVIYDAADAPVFSPLSGENKEEIVEEARRIGTYETSILPYSDCCSYLISAHPATRATLDEVREMEKFDISDVSEEALEQTETLPLGRSLENSGKAPGRGA